MPGCPQILRRHWCGQGHAVETACMDTEQAPAAVTAYLARIGRVPLLTAEQETDLAACIATGRRARDRLHSTDGVAADERSRLEALAASGRSARTEMVTANLRLVVAQAKRFADAHTPLLDLIQEGNVGLIRAVERFDPNLGFKFSTYATWWIRQSIGEALDQQRMIHLPPRVYRQMVTCRRVRDELGASLGRPPTTVEIAGAAEFDEVLVRRLLRSDLPPMSLDDPGLGPARDVVDPVEDTAASADRRLTAERVAEAVDDLPPLEREVVQMRYGLGQQKLSRTAVAQRLDLGLTAVRRLESTALRRLRGWQRVSRLRTQDHP